MQKGARDLSNPTGHCCQEGEVPTEAPHLVRSQNLAADKLEDQDIGGPRAALQQLIRAGRQKYPYNFSLQILLLLWPGRQCRKDLQAMSRKTVSRYFYFFIYYYQHRFLTWKKKKIFFGLGWPGWQFREVLQAIWRKTVLNYI